MSEVWKAIPGYEGFYEVSDAGNVRSIDREQLVLSRAGREYKRIQPGKVLRPCLNGTGYRSVYLWRITDGRRVAISNLVALAFLGPRPLHNEVCHNNGIKTDDRLSNLRYDSHAGNQADRVAHGTDIRGEKTPWAKLTEADVRYIRDNPGNLNQPALAIVFDTTQSQISRIQLRKQWRHVA
jgi:NUMOD4 motif/HNH endonuclease